MSLSEFDEAAVAGECVYELSRGLIEVAESPTPQHSLQIQAIRTQLTIFHSINPGLIKFVSGKGEAKLLVGAFESERHPDLSIYFEPAPRVKGVWSVWVPAIVMEVVTEQSRQRDYQQKPDEYLAFGIREYWIVDNKHRQLLMMSRWRGEWQSKTHKASHKITTPLLPGFTLDLKRVFAAAK